MRQASINPLARPGHFRANERGSIQVILLVLGCFCLGLGVSAIWYHRGTLRGAAADQRPELSDRTKAILDHLDGPVQIHFYSLLDPSAPPSLSSFSLRVDQLLSAYQQRANGKILLTRSNPEANSSPNAAVADGIKGFSLDKGDGCYLGLALSCQGKKETLAQLFPEWEAALESDLSRAIMRLTEAASNPGDKATANAPAADTGMAEEVKRMLPNLASVSVEDGTRTLRQAALREFTLAVSEMQVQVHEAQLRLEQAQNGGSSAAQESAMKHLQEVQAAQGDKLKQIAAKSQAQIAAFQQLKTNGQ